MTESKRKRPSLVGDASDDDSDAVFVIPKTFKRVKRTGCKAMTEEFKCPISHNLPIEPVMASDVSIAVLLLLALNLNRSDGTLTCTF